MASVDRDNAHWGRIGVRLTGSIHWARHNHLELADLTPNPQSRASPVSKYNPPPPTPTPHPQPPLNLFLAIREEGSQMIEKVWQRKRLRKKGRGGTEERVGDMNEQILSCKDRVAQRKRETMCVCMCEGDREWNIAFHQLTGQPLSRIKAVSAAAFT